MTRWTGMLEKMERAAREAGDMMRSADRARLSVHQKEGVGNFVTDCDVMVQGMLEETLLAALPGARFIGEESQVNADVHKGRCFIVDPIDGTTNFIRGAKASAVSIALCEDGEIVCGVVYNPYRDELFSAEKGKGAFCNGAPIHAGNRPLSGSLLVFGLSAYLRGEITNRAFSALRTLFDRAEDIRSSGSAAIDLCDVAMGRFDVFFEMILCPWDYAAGALILTEAGGRISTLDGKKLPLDQNPSVLAASGAAYDESLRLLNP